MYGQGFGVVQDALPYILYGGLTMKHLLTVAIAVISQLSFAANAHNRSEMEEANVAMVTQLFNEGWGANPGWEEVWRAHFSPDIQMYFHAHPVIEGLDAAIAFNQELFAGFPTLHVDVEQVIAEGDTVVIRSRLRGSHDGVFLGAPASGAEVDVPDVTVFRMQNSKIVEHRYFTDLLAVMTAIGAVPAVD